MAGKPFLRRGLTWAAWVVCMVGVALVTGAGGAWAATHYPAGSLCYDCHAVSKSKMVVGTHLIKKSDKTVALGVTGSSTPIPCLFCHEKNAVSVTGRTEMSGVWDHFDATSTSKHPAYVQSGFTPDSLRFDCLDCHTGITLGVVSDGAGNARIHGIDAASQDLDVYGTLIGNPANAAAVSTATCQNAACHSATGSTTGGYTAPARHGMNKTMPGATLPVVTINDAGGAPTSCTQCHGTHNSYQNTSLVTLRTDGTTSNNLGDPLATRVTPDKCGECHSQDDAGVYTNKGHGQSTISGGTVGCTACHSGSVPHGFSRSAPGTNSLRFSFAENTTKQSAIRQQPPYNQVFSVCLTCHSQYSGKEHGAAAYAGCNDCHEPHGVGVSTNVKMIRRQIPKVNASGQLIYGESATTGTWEINSYLVARDFTFKTDGTGLCDNAECHQGRIVAGDTLYPLSTFLTGGRHSGGDVPTTANFDCESCHTHTDEGGSWGAKASCTTCHGQPPPPADSGYTTYAESNTPHQRHAAAADKGGYGYPCQACHFDYTSAATHNTTPKTYQSLNFDVARNSSSARSYTAGTCNNLYCHSDGQRSTSVGSAQWMTGTSTPDWRTQNLACNSCHGISTTPNTLTFGAPDHANGTGGHTANSHNRHAVYACRVCHFDTISDANPADGWTLANPPSSHVNNIKNLRADDTTATFTSTGTTPATCNNISCHNGGNAVWGATLGCSDCHFRTTAQGGDLDNFVYGDGTLSAVNSDEWTATGHGRTTAYPSGNPAGSFAGPPSDPRGCAYCHSFLGTAQNPLVAHGVGTNPFRLANKSGTAEDNGWNNVCLVCHKTGDSGYDPDGVGGVYSLRNGAKNVDENHYGLKHTAGRNGGIFCWDCHDPHGDDQHYMVQGGAGVTDRSDGQYGIPVTRRPVTGLNVVGGYTSEDLANSNNTGLCQTCHATAGTIGGALSYNRDTFTPLANHNGANTQRCTACHTHDGDFGAGCTACHGYPPPESPFAGTTATWISDKAATPATLGAHNTHAAGATPYVSGDCNSTCHTGANHLTNKLTANMGVKAATVGASTGIYKYSTVNNFDNWVGGALPGNQSVVDDTCTNVSCHASTYSANSFRSAANPTYTRYWNANLNCYACHAYDGVAAAAPRPTANKIATGSHGAHVDTYALACTNCHPSGAYTNAHRSGFVNFATNFGATRTSSATGGFYDLDGIDPFSTVANLVPRENGGTGYFCANVYCHSGGDPRGPETIAYRNDTRWTVATTGDCGTCHAVDAVAGSLATNVHEKHVGSAAGQYGYACTACHATVVGGVKPAYTIASTALHVNGANNVAFATNEGTYATTGGTVAPDGGTCSVTYCHSQGLDRSAPYTGTATAPVTTADWDAVQGTAGCGYCHGNPPAYANNTTIRPNATNLTKKNSHAKHAGYTCDRCHYTTTQNGTTIASVANHANKAWEVAPNTGAGVTFTVAVQGTLSDASYTPTTCNTISCHGGGNAQWGATLTCADCHFAASDLDNWNIADGTVALVSSGEWAAAGHGRTSAYPSGNPAGNFAGPASDPQGCAYCHSFLGTANNPLVTHGLGTNPFRLANKSGTGEDGGWNNVCLVCHKTGNGGYDPDGATAGYTSRNGAKNVDENHYGTKHTAATKGGTFCWDCHDPHGDAQHYMIHSGNGSAAGRGVTDVSDGVYGIPVTSRTVTGLDVITGGYTSVDLANAANTGLCQTCHASSGGAASYNRSTFTPLTDHNGADGTRCTVCHSHSNDFAPSGCNTCHGGATAGQSPTTTNNWPDSITANTYPDRAGAHAAHIAAIGTGNSACTTCHPGNPPSGHPDGSTAPARVSNMDTDGNGTPDSDTSARFLTLSGATDTDGRYNAVTQTCLNINCHNNTQTPGWYAGADTTPPVFSPNNTITVTNPNTDGNLLINWNTATDAATPPVRYDLYRQNGTVANACATGTVIASNLGTTGYLDVGLTNGSTYSYCVRAKDSVTPTPNGANTTTAQGIPTAPTPAAVTYFLTKRNTGTIYGAVSFNATGACGTAGTAAANNPGAPTTIPYVWRGGLETSLFCGTASANNFVSNSSPANGNGNTFENMLAFYTPTTYATATTVTGATASGIWMRGSTGTEDVRVWLAAVNPTTGALTLSATSANQANIGTTVAARFTNLSTLSVNVPAGSRLALLVTWADVDTTTSTNDRIMVDNVSGQISQIAVTETPAADTTPPTFGGLTSAADAATGGAVNLAWTAATDPSTPIRYTVYALQSSALPAAATLFQAGNIVQQNITGTTTTVTGLTNGLPYFFGVRATDAANNAETNTVIRPAAAPGVIPTGGGGGDPGCTLCHGMPPALASNGRSHAAHLPQNPVAADCNACHPGTSAYTNAHQDGLYQLGFSGTAYSGSKVNSVLTVANGGTNYYVDSTSNGVDDGTCSNTGCHGAATVTWGGTLANGCFACHTGAEPANGAKPVQTVGNGPNAVTLAQYQGAGSQGHGNTTTFPGSGTAGPGFTWSSNPGCYNCHDASSQHTPTKSAADPYRLGAYATNTDGLCLQAGCHDTPAVLAHSKAITGSSKDWPPTGGTDYAYKCVDCHDPHGDANYYMVRSHINNPTGLADTTMGSNQYGTPNDTALSAVTFTSLAGYAANSYAMPGGDGICEVCHTQTTLFRRGGTAENVGTHVSRTGDCMPCHPHDAGFKGAGHAVGSACKECHSSVQGSRRSPMGEFNAAYQHGNTWANLASADCEKCHLESSQDGAVVLKVWNANATAGSSSYTTVTYNPAALHTVNAFCLSCHDADTTKITFTGNATPPADMSRYALTTTYLSHNYTPTANADSGATGVNVYNTVPVMNKARSPHGKPTLNQVKGPDQTVFTDAAPVACLHCHPSHGSAYASPVNYGVSKTADGNAGWTTSSGGKMVGGNPSALAGVGRDYANEGALAGNETFCWACHDNVGVNDMRGDSNAETVSAGNVITHWQGTWTRPTGGVFSYKTAAFRSNHFYPAKTGGTFSGGTPGGTRLTQMQCLSCHDPHGNSTDGQYYAFGLKGQWMTSPYKEDRLPNMPAQMVTGTSSTAATSAGYQIPWKAGQAAAWNFSFSDPDRRFDAGPRAQPNKPWSNPPNVGHGYNDGSEGPAGTGIVGVGNDGYFIDDNTFGVKDVNGRMWPAYVGTTANGQSVNAQAFAENADQFGGLCAKCHADSATQTGAQLISRLTTEWSGHASVKGAAAALNDILTPNQAMHMHAAENIVGSAVDSGVRLINSTNLMGAALGWGYKPRAQQTAGTKVLYHTFSCSKCHTPHASRLPRLMISNCLDIGLPATGRNAYPKHRTSGSWTYGYSSSNLTVAPWGGDPTDGGGGTEAWHYTSTVASASARQFGRPMHCHNTAATNTGTAGQAPSAVTGGGWNAVTGW